MSPIFTMKFKVVQKGLKDAPFYGKTGSTGKTIELTGRLADKAMNNPALAVVKTVKKAAKKK